jgi:hypothetical protein
MTTLQKIMEMGIASSSVVMPGLDPGIHSGASVHIAAEGEWIAGSSPAMTTEKVARPRIRSGLLRERKP